MQSSEINQIRQEQTLHALTALNTQIPGWIAHRERVDADERGVYIGKHKTQLQALQSVLAGALGVLDQQTRQLDVAQEVGSFYEQCRQLDRAVLWLERLWDYYRVKLDQRDDDRWRDVLLAADEVVWSCYRQVFTHAAVKHRGLAQGPTPLAYIEPFFSPAALQRHQRLRGALAPEGTPIDGLEAFLEKLPIPLLRLPPWCAGAPWWLVYVGHEVGHFVQEALGLIGPFRDSMEHACKQAQAAVPGAGITDGDATHWGAWGEEIFADVFSVLMMGPWALWAIVEVEWSPSATMIRRRGEYPAPVVRLALMARLAAALALDPEPALRGLDPATIAGSHPLMTRDLAVVPYAVEAALAPLPNGLGTLRDLCGYDAGAFLAKKQSARWWAGALQGTQPLSPSQQLKTARLIASGAVGAWADLIEQTPAAARAEAAQRLGGRTCAALQASAEPGTRADKAPSANLTGEGHTLADLLLKASQSQPSPEPEA
jgi:hypothetical protein